MGKNAIDSIELERSTELAATLACSTRLSILIQLHDHPSTVREICEALHLSQSLVSHHLAGLRAIEAVLSVRRKQSKVYRLGPAVQVDQFDGGLEVTLASAEGRIEASVSIVSAAVASGGSDGEPLHQDRSHDPLIAKRSSSPRE